MKKTVLSLGCLALIGSSFGQLEQPVRSFQQLTGDPVKHAPENNGYFTSKVFEVLHEDDFSDPATWVFDNDGQTGADFGWSITSSAAGGTFQTIPRINSTSGGNYAIVKNGVLINQGTSTSSAIGVVYTMTIAEPIKVADLGGSEFIALKYEQFGALFNDLQEVQISTDGSNFTTVTTNTDKTVYDGSNPEAIYPNPETKIINLEPFLNDVPEDLYIRFRWTSRFQADTAPFAWFTFGWMIDDLSLIVTPDHDLEVKTSVWGGQQEIQVFGNTLPTLLSFHTIPETQNPQMNFTANVHNIGATEQSNVTYYVEVNNGEFEQNQVAAAIAPGDSNVFSIGYNPTAVGQYVVKRWIESDSTDQNPGNNQFADVRFNINNNNVYARDNMSNSSSIGIDETVDYHMLYEIFTTQELPGVSIGIATSTTPESSFIVKLEDLENGFIAETEEFFISSSDLGQVIHLPLFDNNLNRPTLQAGRIYDLIVEVAAPGVDLQAGGTASFSTTFAEVKSGTNQGFQLISSAPAMRLNFDPTLNLEQVDASVAIGNIYPNPTAELAHINFNLLNDTEVSVIVTDLAGKVMSTQNLGTLTAGSQTANVDASTFANGIYFVTVTAGTAQTTQKFIKK